MTRSLGDDLDVFLCFEEGRFGLLKGRLLVLKHLGAGKVLLFVAVSTGSGRLLLRAFRA